MNGHIDEDCAKFNYAEQEKTDNFIAMFRMRKEKRNMLKIQTKTLIRCFYESGQAYNGFIQLYNESKKARFS